MSHDPLPPQGTCSSEPSAAEAVAAPEAAAGLSSASVVSVPPTSTTTRTVTRCACVLLSLALLGCLFRFGRWTTNGLSYQGQGIGEEERHGGPRTSIAPSADFGPPTASAAVTDDADASLIPGAALDMGNEAQRSRKPRSRGSGAHAASTSTTPSSYAAEALDNEEARWPRRREEGGRGSGDHTASASPAMTPASSTSESAAVCQPVTDWVAHYRRRRQDMRRRLPSGAEEEEDPSGRRIVWRVLRTDKSGLGSNLKGLATTLFLAMLLDLPLEVQTDCPRLDEYYTSDLVTFVNTTTATPSASNRCEHWADPLRSLAEKVEEEATTTAVVGRQPLLVGQSTAGNTTAVATSITVAVRGRRPAVAWGDWHGTLLRRLRLFRGNAGGGRRGPVGGTKGAGGSVVSGPHDESPRRTVVYCDRHLIHMLQAVATGVLLRSSFPSALLPPSGAGQQLGRSSRAVDDDHPAAMPLEPSAAVTLSGLSVVLTQVVAMPPASVCGCLIDAALKPTRAVEEHLQEAWRPVIHIARRGEVTQVLGVQIRRGGTGVPWKDASRVSRRNEKPFFGCIGDVARGWTNRSGIRVAAPAKSHAAAIGRRELVTFDDAEGRRILFNPPNGTRRFLFVTSDSMEGYRRATEGIQSSYLISNPVAVASPSRTAPVVFHTALSATNDLTVEGREARRRLELRTVVDFELLRRADVFAVTRSAFGEVAAWAAHAWDNRTVLLRQFCGLEVDEDCSRTLC